MSTPFPIPEGGNNKIKMMLTELKEDQKKLFEHPFYKEGYDDGLRDAKEKYQKLSSALAEFYKIDSVF